MKKPAAGERPAFEAQIISTLDFSDLDVRGELRLLIFDGQLVTTWFYPEDPDTYERRLKEQRGLRFKASPGSQETEANGTLIWISRDAEGRPFVGWTDLALDKLRNDWISKYALRRPQSELRASAREPFEGNC